MSAATATVPAAGWYPDPHAPEGLRWWDGAVWTNFTTDALEREPEPQVPHVFADAVADAGDGSEVPVDDEGLDDIEPIEFSWADPGELFEVTVAEAPEETGPFTFRSRSVESRVEVTAEPALEVPALPVYESPLATIASPVSVRVEVPVRIEVPAPPAVSAPEPAAAVAAPPTPPAVLPRRKVALAGTGAAVVVAAAAALLTNVITGDPGAKVGARAAAGSSLAAGERVCMKEWNTATTAAGAQLRVTLGQFEGAYAKVARVQPIPGTVMAPDSCALTVYDGSSDTHAVFVSGVKDQDGYLDVTSYPRAAELGWPKNARQANVTIRSDGSLRAF